MKRIKTKLHIKSILCKSLPTITTAGIMLLLLFSCGNSSTEKKTQEPVVVKEHSQANTQVSVTKLQYEALKIQLGTIEQKNLYNVLKATGFLKVPPQSKANITSALGGTLQSILVQEGNHVSKGQTVLKLVNPEFIKMQQEFLETQSKITFAEAEYNRQKELSSKNVSALKIYQQAESEFKTLRVKLSSLKQQLAMIHINTLQLTYENISQVINVASPISGSISEINVNIGAHAEGSKTLMVVVDNSHLHLDLFVFEQDFPKIKVGQKVDFSLTNLAGKSYKAKIYSIGSAFENETKTIPLHAEIPGNKEGLIEGMNVTGSINIGNKLSSAVSSSAIASYSGNDYVFITSDIHLEEEKENKETKHIAKDKAEHVKETEKEIIGFKRIQIKKGIADGGYTEITPLEEIPTDAKIVTNGAFYLMAMLTNAGEEE